MVNVKNFAVNPESELIDQIDKFATSKAYKDCKIRVMADGHAGKGCAVGSVIEYKDKISPFTVGVDVSCRVSAFRIPENNIDFEKLDKVIHERVPSGHYIRQKEHEFSQTFPYDMLYCWPDIRENEDRYRKSMGTLGGGNHFISVEGDYLLVHCGTRNLGLQVANYYQNVAIERRDNRIDVYKRSRDICIKAAAEAEDYQSIESIKDNYKRIIEEEPENDLCYLSGLDMEHYLNDMKLLQMWSLRNHAVIATEIFDGMGWRGTPVVPDISTIHNYVDVEQGVIRKGAIDASLGKPAIIPLNMASGSLVVRGKGNEDYLYSGPHGAGRAMSRKEARMTLDMAEYQKAMEGIYTTSVCKDTLDEAPQSYKDADAIMKAIEPTVEILEHIRPRYNFKAKG